MYLAAYSLRRRRRFNRSPFKGDVKKVMVFGGQTKTLPSLPLYVLLGSANLNSITLLICLISKNILLHSKLKLSSKTPLILGV